MRLSAGRSNQGSDLDAVISWQHPAIFSETDEAIVS